MESPRTTAYAAYPLTAPALSHPKPERRVAGNPLRETWNQVDAPLAGAARLSAGIWRCEPGEWRIVFGPAQQEVFTVLSGRCRIHDALGGFQEVGPGGVLHIPSGFEGRFEVLETVTKSYVITE